MPPKLGYPVKKTTFNIKLRTLERIKEVAVMLDKKPTDIVNLALEQGVEVIYLALDPKNAGLLKEIGEKYKNDIQTH